jgi:hypothetical protein
VYLAIWRQDAHLVLTQLHVARPYSSRLGAQRRPLS